MSLWFKTWMSHQKSTGLNHQGLNSFFHPFMDASPPEHHPFKNRNKNSLYLIKKMIMLPQKNDQVIVICNNKIE